MSNEIDVIVVKNIYVFLIFVKKYVRLTWKKEILCYYNYRGWICLNMPECAYINRILNMPQILNMPKFWLWQCCEYGRVLNMWTLHSILSMPEYALTVVNISWALNMPGFWMTGFWIYKSYTGSKYSTIWLNMSE